MTWGQTIAAHRHGEERLDHERERARRTALSDRLHRRRGTDRAKELVSLLRRGSERAVRVRGGGPR